MQPAKLVLDDGTTFSGMSPKWQTNTYFGEVVFNTGMVGYPETLTDPSYTGQILTFTYPIIGNYGIPDKSSLESKKIHVAGVVVSSYCTNHSHYTSTQSLLNWLKKEKVPIISGIDTRALTKLLRTKGVMLGAITANNELPKKFIDPNKENLVTHVSTKTKTIFASNNNTPINLKNPKIILVDCGLKSSILTELRKLPISISVVPYNYDYTNENFDGIFLSNGPGDPTQCIETIAILKKALKQKKPTFGICLGSQILALAANASTYKLCYGHRGHNHPVINLHTNKCFITSQNHGYAVDEKTLSENWQVIFRNLNDNSVEGIAHKSLPFFAVQFHPEASPGPTDTAWLFQKFYDEICLSIKSKCECIL